MRRIKNVAVLGSGIMGAGIACHLANAGFSVLMLDILPNNLDDSQSNNPSARNAVATQALKQIMKSKPAPLVTDETVNQITIGNLEDDLEKIKDCDWVIEAVIERLDIKKSLFGKVDQFRTPGTVVSSNTSGIPIHLMSEGRSEDFKKHFLG